MQTKYNFYATLLDAFRNYLECDITWEKYWGWSDNPQYSLDEYHEQQYRKMIDTLNRVPYDSEAADRGTAFNEVVDCIIEHRKSDKITIEKLAEQPFLQVGYNKRTFLFPVELCREVAKYFAGAVTQQFVEGVLPTAFGGVRLYGFIDELSPYKIHDIKTTSSYNVGKYKKNFQHLVYPFALCCSGTDVRDFEYNVVEFGKNGKYTLYKENYTYVPERDIPILQGYCEELISFIEEHKKLITNSKLFIS